MTSSKIRVVYVSSNAFKRMENQVFADKCILSDGVTRVKDVFHFEFREVSIPELLEIDIRVMVQAEVTNAYSQIRVPCIVEHAGLVFDDFRAQNYPGGLTKPMWNALGDKFVDETHSSGRRATARAVVAYCDGTRVETFVGETPGTLAGAPRGARRFYWDTVFIPDGPTAPLTFAEISEDPGLGLEYKIVTLSQSTRAMLKFLDYRQRHSPTLWPGVR